MTEKTPLNVESASLYSSGSSAIVHQAVNLIKQVVGFDISTAPDGASFRSVTDDGKRHAGIQAVVGRLEESVLFIKLEVLRVSRLCKVEPDAFFMQLSALGEKTRLAEPESADPFVTGLWVEMKLDARPMSISRAAVVLDELKKIDVIARSLQKSVPEIADEAHIEKLYAEVSEYLSPVIPARAELVSSDPRMEEWTKATAAYLEGNLPVAVSASDELTREYGVAAVAATMIKSGVSLGLLKVPGINAKGVVDLAAKAPGIVVVPVDRLRIGSNMYEISGEVLSMLGVLKSAPHGVIFTGAYDQLQEAFHGGQGGETDPLYPVVRHVPEVASGLLIQHTVEVRSRQLGGVSADSKAKAFDRVEAALEKSPSSGRGRVVRPLVTRELSRAGSRASGEADAEDYARALGEVQETLGGMSGGGGGERPKHVQSRFMEAMVDSDLSAMMKRELMAQDDALDRLARRLKTECLTRPLHQPIRYCAQGTPATGKSRSAALLAERLKVPFINIDAASMPNFYTASAQLLGSGRGIVGSNRSGRLEQAAKHYAGAVVEVSDLDHALPDVRGALADLFLQVLETGRAQSATGAMFSCASLIFAFTINLPDGMDEAVRKTFGFGAAPAEAEVRRKVVGEIKNLFSTAFLSRIGTPIVFEPLSGAAVGTIIEKTIESAMRSVMQRLAIEPGEIEIEGMLGGRIASKIDSNRESFGARLLIEHSRSLVADAVSELRACCAGGVGTTLVVSCDESGALVFTTK